MYDFIFQPGFSTKSDVSKTSGRGVGLDVVKKNISSLGGTINVVSDADIGTKFFLMDHVKGNIYWELLLPNLDKPSRRQVYLSMNDTISKLHNVNFEKINLGDYGKHENYMQRQIHRWTKQYKDSETQEIPEMNELINWLP